MNSHPDSRHYTVLDGLRGIAAAVVVAVHTQLHWGIFLPRGFLAVDLFFVLSGFVLSHAYVQPLRNGSLGLRQFMVLRVARLYPAFLLGLLVSAVSVVGPLLLHHKRPLGVMLNYIGAVLLGLVMLPLPISVDGTALFTLNVPMWSLIIELGSNLLLAGVLVLPCLRPAARPGNLPSAAPSRAGLPPLAVAPRLALITGLALLLWLCSNTLGTVNMGSQWIALGIVGGFARACYGMLAGSLLYTARATLQRSPLGLAGLLLAVALMLTVQLTPALTDNGQEVLLELCGVLVAMPLVVILALGWSGSGLDSPMLWLGRISYPLYVIHFPILHICEVLQLDRRLHTESASGIATVVLAVAAAHWMSTRYEGPMRLRLRRLLDPRPAA